jgi:hypothetical protein
MVTPIFAVVDVRTAAELVNFSYPMPAVSAGLKRILDSPNCQAAARLLPVIAKIHGLTSLTVIDICYVGGGVLMSGYKTIDKVLEEMAGKNVADGTTKGLDHDLHSNFTKWRQCLMMLHREATDVEKEDREEFAAQVSIEDKVKWFAGQYHFTPEANTYCSGAYSKCLLKQGLTYEIDQRTDYRRAKSASARRGDLFVPDKGKKTDVPEKVVIATGQDVFDCLVRKFMTLLLLFGDADIVSHGFTNGSYGALAGTTRWITLADVYKLKKAAAGLAKVTRAKAEELVDWFEEKISVAVKAPFLRTLACALGENSDVFEARIDSRVVAATPPATKREKLDVGPPSAPSKKQKKAAAKAAKLAAEAQAVKKSEGKKEKDDDKKVKEGLERMDGGNPAGPPCRNYAKGTCVGKCRFSHEAVASPEEDSEE